jgi:hypothetical protein
MTHARARCLVVLVLVIVALPLLARPARAARQATPAGRQAPAVSRQAPAPPAVVPPTVVTDSQDAQQTRKALDELLKRYPPTLGRVLKLDPMLLENPAYLSPYPGLAAFLAQHPEIGRSPRFFLANVDAGDYYSTPPDRETEAIRMWQRMMAGLVAFMVFIIVTATLVWLIKTLIDYRRWHRLSKVQAEVHTKLLDRFSANEDLLAYVQSPAGRRFLESAPIALDAGGLTIGAPLRRILWAVEAGLVLAAGGIGLIFVSGRVVADVREPLFVIGVLAVSLGAGFVLSAIVSFFLSKRLGLFERAQAANGERSAPGGV